MEAPKPWAFHSFHKEWSFNFGEHRIVHLVMILVSVQSTDHDQHEYVILREQLPPIEWKSDSMTRVHFGLVQDDTSTLEAKRIQHIRSSMIQIWYGTNYD